jgi:monofunctional chorismate mutase
VKPPAARGRRGDLTVAAVRGAISAPANTRAAIHAATLRLLAELAARNGLLPADIISALFTTTPDLSADFPAHAARKLGWTEVPLLGATEMGVRGAPARIVRVLLTVRDVPRGKRLVPVYLDGAASLRPDLRDATATARVPRRRRRVALVGLGQIGGSIGYALGSRPGWRRIGFDARRAVSAAALRSGAIDEVAGSLEQACAGADLAVLAVPVDLLPRLVSRAAAALPKGAALLDTGSSRAGVTAALRAATRRGVRACGGHPLAGNEGRGLAAARAGLFENATFALLPAGSGVPRIVRELVHDLGAVPLVVDPRTHDAALARTSHLPYVLACALARVGGAAARRRLSGPGFAGMTRLAASDPRVARAYAGANRARVRAAWRALRREVDRELARLGTPRR